MEHNNKSKDQIQLTSLKVYKYQMGKYCVCKFLLGHPATKIRRYQLDQTNCGWRQTRIRWKDKYQNSWTRNNKNTPQHCNINKRWEICSSRVEITGAMYGLSQSGHTTNQGLQKHLAKYGYYPLKLTPGLWKHKTRPISLTLGVDSFGINYTNKDDIDHSFKAIKDK